MRAVGIIISAVCLPLVAADWQFRSRPDLAPPRLNISIPATTGVETGYLFIAPFSSFPESNSHGPRQAGPYIFRDDGELVWSGYGYYSIWSTNFQKSRWNGQDVLICFEGDHNPAYGHGHGHATFLDQRYETIRELRAGNHKLMDKHEFRVVDEKTALIQVYQPVVRNLREWGAGKDQQWIVDAIFQELDIETGKVIFEWSSLEHVSPDEAILPLNPGQAGSGYNSSDAWDYFHINSVDKDREGNYLISARDACSIHKVNGTTGEIIWRLAGKRSDFDLGDNADFCFQHHARFVSQDDSEEVISLYDNSAHGTEHGHGHQVHTNRFSQGKILRLNTKNWTADVVQAFAPPEGHDILSKSQGSTQLLPNGNALVNWGSSGALTEYLPNGSAIFHTTFDSGFLNYGVQNYRGYRFNWTGLPNEEPAIVAFQNGAKTGVYVSWNGDTETKSWRFLEVSNDVDKYLGESSRNGFETVFWAPEGVQQVKAEAIGKDGRLLRITEVVKVQDDIAPATAYNSVQNALQKPFGV